MCAADIAAAAPTLSLRGLLLALASLLTVGAAAFLRRRLGLKGPGRAGGPRSP
jgi:hypothetical protein